MSKQASRTKDARVTLTNYVIDGFSVDFDIETGGHRYEVLATWTEWDGWDIGAEDELGNALAADELARRLGYDDDAHLLAVLTDGLFHPGDRRFALSVKAGA